VIGLRRGAQVSALAVGVVACLFCSGGARLGAATPVRWSGAGDNEHWSDPDNWVGGVVPADGDVIVLAATAARCTAPEGLRTLHTDNDLGAGLNVAGITEEGPCGFSVEGDAITLSGPLTIPNETFFNEIELNVPLTLATDLVNPNRASFGGGLDLAGHDIVSNDSHWNAWTAHDSVGGATVTVKGTSRVLLLDGGGYGISVEGGRADVFSAADVTMTGGALSVIGATSVYATGGTILLQGNASVTGDLFASPEVTFAEYENYPHHGAPLEVGGQLTMAGTHLLIDIPFNTLPGDPDPAPGATLTILHSSTTADLGTFADVPDGTVLHDQFGYSTWRINYDYEDGFTVTATLVATEPPPTTTTTTTATLVPSSTTSSTSVTSPEVEPQSTVLPGSSDQPGGSGSRLPATGSGNTPWIALLGVLLLTAGATLLRSTRV
jgi:LPXTG-motif cell wall-anchored protein